MSQTVPQSSAIINSNVPDYNRIAIWYDLINSIVTLGLDSGWRRKVAELLQNRGHLRILDIGCGSGKQIFAFFTADLPLISVNGIDLSEGMLKVAQKRIVKHGIGCSVYLESGDATVLRFEKDFFDAVTMSFGLSGIPDTQTVLSEARRVLKPDCPLIILDLINPRSFRFPGIYSLYFKYLVPLIGGLISGSASTYKSIAGTLERLPQTEQLSSQLKSSGFHKISIFKLFPGAAAIFLGKKVPS